MKFSEHRDRFCSAMPEIKAQFGNLITLRERGGLASPGIHQCFVASLMQFQPLAVLSVNDGERSLEWKQTGSELTSAEERKDFCSGDFSVFQRCVVERDTVLLHLKLSRSREAVSGKPRFVFSGSGLFSPQGIPYHWDEMGRMNWVCGKNSVTGVWNGETHVKLDFEGKMGAVSVGKLEEDGVCKEQYFTSFNLKKRFTYWTEEKTRTVDTGLRDVSARNMFYCAEWLPEFDENGAAEINIRFSLDSSGGSFSGENRSSYEETLERVEKSITDFAGSIPEFSASDADLERIYYTSWNVLRSGVIDMDSERFPYRFTSVNKFHYYNQFFWDSAFQAIAWMWNSNPEPAESEMKNFAVQQWRNGMMPYELFMFTVNGREWMEGDGLTSGTTQPPVIAVTVKEIFARYGNRDFPRFFYEPLLKYENWLWRYRDLEKRGLCSYVNIWETGWDNSPRFDSLARNRVLDPYLEGVDFNVFIYLVRQLILETAEMLGLPEPVGVRERMELCRKSMNELMYNPEDGFYYDLEAGTDIRVPVKAASGLFPLLTDIPDAEMRGVLIDRYLMNEKEFLTPVPVPSVSRSEESYNPADFWRGANWPQVTWSLIYAVSETDPEKAGVLLDRFLRTTTRNKNCYEYYHSETGEGAGLPFQGWGALYTDFIIRFLAGIRPQPDGFRFRPLPSGYRKFRLDGINIKGLKLSVEKDCDTWIFRAGDGEIRFSEGAEFDAALSADALIFNFKPECGRLLCSGSAMQDGDIVRIRI